MLVLLYYIKIVCSLTSFFEAYSVNGCMRCSLSLKKAGAKVVQRPYSVGILHESEREMSVEGKCKEQAAPSPQI